MYCLDAIVAAAPVLRALAGEARGVPLDGHLVLLPVTDDLRADLENRLAACSATGPVAHLEADYFGGVGTQSARVWRGGELVLGPLRLEEDDPRPPEGTPLSRALRHLGVARAHHHDEFAAVALGRHRRTEDWVVTPPTAGA
ncbi:hypothetical protein [Actinosynnema sp. NPDC020468]|uniref:hypothetical protein n=1 Tax=Actinosynnema sp. NPDC020468 TaxID=3154488 RepID=UPI0033E9C084